MQRIGKSNRVRNLVRALLKIVVYTERERERERVVNVWFRVPEKAF